MCLRRRPKQSRRTREISNNGLLQPYSDRQQGPVEGALLDSQPLAAINEEALAPRNLSAFGISNAQRQTSPTESQGTASTTIQMQKTDTMSNRSSSGVSETKFLYSQAERLLAFSMEVWFQDNDVPGRHIMETALKQVRTATGTTPTSRHVPEPDFARSKPYPVSINYAAWCFIGIKMAETASGDIHKHLKSSKRFYEQNIIYGLRHMSVADLPTTALFQALVSVIMDRVPSLGPGRIPKTTVAQDPISPVHGLYNLFSDMAEVQDAVVRALQHSKNSNSYSEQVENLERTVHGFRGDLEKVKIPTLANDASLISTCSFFAFANPIRSGPVRLQERHGRAIKMSISWLTTARKLLFYPMNPYFTLYAFMLAHNDVETYLLLSEITQGLLNETWNNDPFSELISLLSSLMDLASKMFLAQSGSSQQAECQISLSAGALPTALPGPLVLDEALVEEELFSPPIEWNEEGTSLADSLALMIDWDVPEAGRNSHSSN
ncbi:hypothetical protein K456DRAFT_42067 [Colletotrichum gloeosporioides 23]|nr:hypothetical protein K456DRAFT_42067 [Colletotrichum gloeosporioides 23]